eukprot:g11324.t1
MDRLLLFLRTLVGGKTSIKTKGIYEENIDSVARKLEGFSGREIAKFMISLQALAYAQPNAEIDSNILNLLVEAKLEEHKLKEVARENSDQYGNRQ